MSRRRRRVREQGRVRKTVEVLVSGLFGMAVVGVVLVILQNGSASAPNPSPSATVTGQTFPTGGTDGGLVGIRSASTGTPSTPGAVRSAKPGAVASASAGAQGAAEAQETGETVAARPTSTKTPGGSQSTPTAGSSTSGSTATATAAASATATASSTTGALGGLVGGLVGGVLGLL
jgi:hypothetical protein